MYWALIVLIFILYFVWNYDSFQVDIRSRFKNVYQFAKVNTKSFDESHNLEHAVAVCKNALLIAKRTFSRDTYEKYEDILIYASLLHDVCDHKYEKESISRFTLDDFVISELGEKKGKVVLDIIDNVSYSKEVKGKLKYLGKYQILRDIVSDADKIEALGSVGLQRCMAYARKLNPSAKTDEINLHVLQHCADKLLLLWSDFIRTRAGRDMAYVLHSEMQDWVRDNIHRVNDINLKKELHLLL